MKVYYAHSKKIYGTAAEAHVRGILEESFDTVICPNRDIGEKGAIGPYLDAIDQCDAVIATSFEGHIGRGVFDEVRHAIENDIDVYEFRMGELIAVINVELFDANDWAVNYGTLVTDMYYALNKRDKTGKED
jgi:hypothetical protein